MEPTELPDPDVIEAYVRIATEARLAVLRIGDIEIHRVVAAAEAVSAIGFNAESTDPGGEEAASPHPSAPAVRDRRLWGAGGPPGFQRRSNG